MNEGIPFSTASGSGRSSTTSGRVGWNCCPGRKKKGTVTLVVVHGGDEYGTVCSCSPEQVVMLRRGVLTAFCGDGKNCHGLRRSGVSAAVTLMGDGNGSFAVGRGNGRQGTDGGAVRWVCRWSGRRGSRGLSWTWKDYYRTNEHIHYVTKDDIEAQDRRLFELLVIVNTLLKNKSDKTALFFEVCLSVGRILQTK